MNTYSKNEAKRGIIIKIVMCGNNVKVNKDMRHNSQTNRVISGSFAARRVIEGLFDSLLLQGIMLHGGQAATSCP